MHHTFIITRHTAIKGPKFPRRFYTTVLKLNNDGCEIWDAWHPSYRNEDIHEEQVHTEHGFKLMFSFRQILTLHTHLCLIFENVTGGNATVCQNTHLNHTSLTGPSLWSPGGCWGCKDLIPFSQARSHNKRTRKKAVTTGTSTCRALQGNITTGKMIPLQSIAEGGAAAYLQRGEVFPWPWVLSVAIATYRWFPVHQAFF